MNQCFFKLTLFVFVLVLVSTYPRPAHAQDGCNCSQVIINTQKLIDLQTLVEEHVKHQNEDRYAERIAVMESWGKVLGGLMVAVIAGVIVSLFQARQNRRKRGWTEAELRGWSDKEE